MFKSFMASASNWVVPVLLLAIPLYAFAFKKVKVYESFIEGAKEGFWIGVKIIPYLVAILVAIGMFRASGALNWLIACIHPITSYFGFPSEALPVALLRPLSGSGTLGLVSDVFQHHGPDSFTGRLVSVIEGSTETTFYVLAVYFGSISIRKSRFALSASLLGDCAGVISAYIICRMLF